MHPLAMTINQENHAANDLIVIDVRIQPAASFRKNHDP
jgi:hypothetical protein